MKKMKVMHVLCMGTYSGAENVAITLINSLKNKVDSVYVSPDGSIREIVNQNGIEHYTIDKVTVSNIRKAINDIKPNIIHAHDFTAGIICAVVSGRIPVINHLHNNSPWLKSAGVKSIIYGFSCLRYGKILTVSDSVMDEYIFGKTFKKKTIVIGNPINLEIIRKRANEKVLLQDELIPICDMTFLGRLTRQKNIFFLLDIIKNLKMKKSDLTVSIIGDGELREEFEEKIREYGLEKNIIMYGFQKNPYLYLKAAKVMCMPSKWEGFGLAAVEGLALGKPVVAAPVGGLAEIINDSCGKLCVKMEDYVSELFRLLTDAEYYNLKSEGAFSRANDFDNMKQYRDGIWKIYCSLVNRKKRN